MNKFFSALDWLTKTSGTLSVPQRRRANMLAWMLLGLFLLTLAGIILVLLTDPSGSPRRTLYLSLILVLIILFMVAYGLNRAGNYYISAELTVASTVIGSWIPIILDPNVHNGDFVPVTFISLSVLLSSLLLPPAFTIILAALQLFVLTLAPFLSPATESLFRPSLIGFVFFAAVLSILANFVNQRNFEQIEKQTRQLALSEAQLRELSIHDHLTNLYNRRYLGERLEREIQQAKQGGYPVGMIMMDIDNLKKVNDKLGHPAGDKLLEELGELIYAHVRHSDIACRYGGDEFIIILPEASIEGTKKRAEQLREKVTHLYDKEDPPILRSVTISAGIAVYPDHGSTGKEVLKSADSALYRAKKQGRNCVAVSEEILQENKISPLNNNPS